MLLSRTLKTVALAAVLVAATASASMAAYMNQGSSLKANHFNASPNVSWVAAGHQVSIIGQWGQWYKVNPAGPTPNGWVRKYKVDTNNFPNFPNGNGQFCIGGPNGYLCLGN